MLGRAGLIALLLAAPAVCFAQTPGFTSDPKSGCRVYNADPGPGETIVWYGDCRDGLAQGKGVLQWYEGGMSADRYEGDYQGGRAEGHGLYISLTGDRYEGGFHTDQKNGAGVDSYANGDRFDGLYRDGLREGIGHLHLGQRQLLRRGVGP